MDEKQMEAAKRIFELMDPWEKEGTEEETLNSIYNTISLDPVSTINYLLDIIDNYTA